MSEPGNDGATASVTTIVTAVGTVSPWKTLVSLGITEHDLTPLQEPGQDRHGPPVGAGTTTPVDSADVSGGFTGASATSRNVPSSA
ncbi:hypothetical protein GA0115259_1040113 [Streptomyces sp. MnatMP-M17]|nr:hypothetical protein GA0115259_1040113 [Streptomyces sp. MnatMP-M17]